MNQLYSPSEVWIWRRLCWYVPSQLRYKETSNPQLEIHVQQEFGFEDPTFGVESAIRMLDSQMAFLGMMWLEGEVSEFKAYRGVNWYYTLKRLSQCESDSTMCDVSETHEGSRKTQCW